MAEAGTPPGERPVAGAEDLPVAGERPLVSVITIFLDAERFLGEAIASVVGQSYGSWELLLIDDGSRDGSTELARRWAARRPGQIRYLEHPGHENRGMSASRNLGVGAARGRFVAFLDADDVWLPAKLGEQVAILERQPAAAMVYGRSEYWTSWAGGEGARDVVQDHWIEPDVLVPPPELLLAYLEGRAAVPPPSSVLVSRRAVAEIGGFVESFRGLFEDQAFYAKLCLRHPVFVAGRCWDRYRQHPDSACSAAERAGGDRAARLVYLDWLERHLDREGVEDRRLLRAVAVERWSARHPQLGRQVRRLRRLRRRLAARRRAGRAVGLTEAKPPPVRFGSLRRRSPISAVWGLDRGRPIDRYYIEGFLAAHAGSVRGRVLEIGGDEYTRRFGAAGVTSEVLNVAAGRPGTTLVADLSRGEELPAERFDCVICTQTLHLIYDVQAAVRTLHKILKPGGTALATLPGISQISRYDMDRWGDYWRFTERAARRLFGEVFGEGNLTVAVDGNVLAALGFLYGLSATELRRGELDYRDPRYELLISVAATKR